MVKVYLACKAHIKGQGLGLIHVREILAHKFPSVSGVLSSDHLCKGHISVKILYLFPPALPVFSLGNEISPNPGNFKYLFSFTFFLLLPNLFLFLDQNAQ